ncbi:MAG: nuclease-related domain-containing protein [Ktedonobacteraceae bacterium]
MANVVSAGPFATNGERVAAEELKKLPTSWIVICNKTLATADGRSYEIDFIVIGENWIFLLDEKSVVTPSGGDRNAGG